MRKRKSTMNFLKITLVKKSESKIKKHKVWGGTSACARMRPGAMRPGCA